MRNAPFVLVVVATFAEAIGGCSSEVENQQGPVASTGGLGAAASTGGTVAASGGMGAATGTGGPGAASGGMGAAMGAGGAGASIATGGVGATVSTGGVGATVSTGGVGAAVSTGGVGAAVSTGGVGAAVSTGGVGAAVSTGGVGATLGTGGAGATEGTGGAGATGGTGGTAASGSGGADSTGGASTGGSGTGGAGSCEVFSFFVTSLVAMRRESGSEDGFGGDLGGLAGADELCRRIAEVSLPCAGQKQWRAFLSTSTEDAIDRVGGGPWYDRVGRLVASTAPDLANTRPAGADSAIVDDLPNEDGVPNHSPDGITVDNHDTLTGSDEQGRLAGADATCSDWTSTDASLGRPRIGHSWPAGSGEHWISSHDAGGCVPGVSLGNTGGGASGTVGAMGGYGGIYCFALTP